MQKGSLGYYLEVLLYEVVYKTLSSCLKMDFPEVGRNSVLKKVQEVRKYADLDLHADRRKLPEEIRARFFIHVGE